MRVKSIFLIIMVILFLPVSVFATVASSSNIYEGIDVSNWQGHIDYEAVKKSGIEIVYIKSSQGSNIIDPYFRINYNNAKANGLKVGFYHFLTARTEIEAIQKADAIIIGPGSLYTNVIPNLLVNGTSGIAVCMATNIPPHNLSEVIDGIIKVIDNPETTIEELMEVIKGPDFPTGAIVEGKKEIREALTTGRGKVVIRSKYEIVEDKKEKKIIILMIKKF